MVARERPTNLVLENPIHSISGAKITNWHAPSLQRLYSNDLPVRSDKLWWQKRDKQVCRYLIKPFPIVVLNPRQEQKFHKHHFQK